MLKILSNQTRPQTITINHKDQTQTLSATNNHRQTTTMTACALNTNFGNDCTAIVCYDPDLPIHLKDTVTMLKTCKNKFDKCNLCNSEMNKCLLVCENGCIVCNDCEPDYFTKGSRRSKVCKQCNGKAFDCAIANPILDSMIKNVRDMDVEFTHGLQQVKNHGYVTEDMANGLPAPDWVPISRKQAMKEAVDQLSNEMGNIVEDDADREVGDILETMGENIISGGNRAPILDNTTNVNNTSNKTDKRKRSAHSEEDWKVIQDKRLSIFRDKQKAKKQKVEDYDRLVIELDSAKEHIKLLEKKLANNKEKIAADNFLMSLGA